MTPFAFALECLEAFPGSVAKITEDGVSRWTFLVSNEETRERVVRWIKKAPIGALVEIRENKRSVDQNSLMWAALTDISRQLAWHGQKLSPEDWKILLMAGLSQELRVVPNIDGTGFVPLGRSSSKLTVQEMTDLIELIFAFGAKHGVTFSDREAA